MHSATLLFFEPDQTLGLRAFIPGQESLKLEGEELYKGIWAFGIHGRRRGVVKHGCDKD